MPGPGNYDYGLDPRYPNGKVGNPGGNASASPPPGAAPAAPGAAAPPDWSSYLGIYGLPPEVISELNSIFNRTPDVQQAVSLALAYVRGTDWYRRSYPGIQDAIAKGVVRNEADYRSRQNEFNQLFRQYMNRDMTIEEYAGYLGEGISGDTLGRRFQGLALEDTYGNDWQYLSGAFGEGRLSDDEKRALGRQQAGLDSALGLRVQRRLRMAEDRVRAAFSGQLATGKLGALNQSGESTLDVGR